MVSSQLHVIFLISLPYNNLTINFTAGFVSWTQACGCSSLEHTSGSVDFSELARALKVLRTHQPRDWSEDDIISIIDELTSKPYFDSYLPLMCTEYIAV